VKLKLHSAVVGKQLLPVQSCHHQILRSMVASEKKRKDHQGNERESELSRWHHHRWLPHQMHFFRRLMLS
jgi:hypothetical protein